MESEAKRLVCECISSNPHITGIENFSAIVGRDALSISFTAITNLGVKSLFK